MGQFSTGYIFNWGLFATVDQFSMLHRHSQITCNDKKTLTQGVNTRKTLHF